MDIKEIDDRINEILNSPELLKKCNTDKSTVYNLRNQDTRTVSYDKKVGFLARAGLLQFKDGRNKST